MTSLSLPRAFLVASTRSSSRVGQHQLGPTVSASRMGSTVPRRRPRPQAAQYVDDGVDLPDVGENWLPGPRLAGAPQAGGRRPSWVATILADLAGQDLQTLIGYGDAADIGSMVQNGWLAPAPPSPSALKAGLADVGQPDDAAFEAHRLVLSSQHFSRQLSADARQRRLIADCCPLTASLAVAAD